MRGDRLHPTGLEVLVEAEWHAARSQLVEAGYSVATRERSYFARLNAVEVLPDGRFRGVGEPRWVNSAAAGAGR